MKKTRRCLCAWQVCCLFFCCGWLLSCSSGREPRFRIGVSQCSDDEWRHQMNGELLREALFYDGVEVDIRTSKDDNEQQAEDIRHFIEAKVDLLIVAPNEAAPITPVVEEAYGRGIPVIVVDRRILSDKYAAYVGADNYKIGWSIGEYIASLLHGKGNVVEISGLLGEGYGVEQVLAGKLDATFIYPTGGDRIRR